MFFLFDIDYYGGLGGAIYAYNTHLNVTGSNFVRNNIDTGNGGAIYRQLNLFDFSNKSFFEDEETFTLESWYENITLSLVIADNVFIENEVRSSVDQSQTDIVCTKLSGLSGFGGAVWLDLKEDFTNHYYKQRDDRIAVKGNIFINNEGDYVNDLYFNLYYRKCLAFVCFFLFFFF